MSESKPLTSKAFHDNMRDAYLKAFDSHEIVSHSVDNGMGRWMLKPTRKGAGIAWVEIVELAGGHIIAHGDIDAMVFGRCGGPLEVGTMVHWMGRRSGPGCGYLKEKACIGNGRETVIEYNHLVAQGESLASLEEDYDKDDYTPEAWEKLKKRWLRAVDRLDCDGLVRPQRAFDKLIGDAWELSWGDVATKRLGAAWGALNRLSTLIRGEKEST